jgi:tetratricopeptide (TPR) repeat protein
LTEGKSEDLGLIRRKLTECKKHLKHENLYHCLLSLKELIEKTLNSNMLPSDQQDLIKEIHALQTSLAESKTFIDIFGQVAFKQDDLATSLEFVCNLLKVQEQDLVERIQAETGPGKDMEKKAAAVMKLIDSGEYEEARKELAEDNTLAEYVAVRYNQSAIEHRKKGEYKEALRDFQKALVALPEDEGLYYNIARLRVDKKEWKLAMEAIQSALKIDPGFKEGLDMLRYIETNLSR